ncbi:helix-turn-helix transcriptional regulator [Thaumasiovibrio subtropicus]|uniref:helix-turn-helix transcriptional regulator n=1 Tax=Thaumasiovibrio subtropicus TaxID=1891207 RepID=UPI000B34DD16|nr:helix-turn-helix transcriptional regulator [Thaumasiovibrio subtropicus]
MDMSPSIKDISSKIKAARVLCSKTQQQMADELKIARQTYLDIESGRTVPRVDALEKIARVTDFPLIWFLDSREKDTGYMNIKESKEVIDFLVTMSKLPSDSRRELLRSSRQMANLLLSYTSDSQIRQAG